MREYWRDLLEGIRVMGFWRCMYARNLYRFHMRLIHLFGRHWFTDVYPGGDHIKWCQWCGERIVISRHRPRNDMADAFAYMMQGYDLKATQSKVQEEK